MKEHRAICMQGLVPLIFSIGLLFFGVFLARGIPFLFPFIILAAVLGFKGLFIVRGFKLQEERDLLATLAKRGDPVSSLSSTSGAVASCK